METELIYAPPIVTIASSHIRDSNGSVQVAGVARLLDLVLRLRFLASTDGAMRLDHNIYSIRLLNLVSQTLKHSGTPSLGTNQLLASSGHD